VPELLSSASGEHLTPLALAALIVGLAAVQSLFGIGLLVFGTPTLLLLGLPFDRVLVLLLPCSIVVSALQVATSGGLALDPFRRQVLVFTAPALLLATAAALHLGSPRGMRSLVGVMLIVTAATRLIRPAHDALARIVRGHLRPLLVGLGVLHGASNLGGGILSVIVGAMYRQKHDARRQIAFCYGIMAGLQLLVVLLSGPPPLDPGLTVLLPLLAGATYLGVGQRLFVLTGQRAFDAGLTGMVTAFGLVLLAT